MTQNNIEERFDILEDDGTPKGYSKNRSAVHRDGDWHRSTHIWVLASDGRVLVQKRAVGKDTFPVSLKQDHFVISLQLRKPESLISVTDFVIYPIPSLQIFPSLFPYSPRDDGMSRRLAIFPQVTQVRHLRDVN